MPEDSSCHALSVGDLNRCDARTSNSEHETSTFAHRPPLIQAAICRTRPNWEALCRKALPVMRPASMISADVALQCIAQSLHINHVHIMF